MSWTHDCLDSMAREPIYSGHHRHPLTLSTVSTYSENDVLPPSHDEVVHGLGLAARGARDRWQQSSARRHGAP